MPSSFIRRELPTREPFQFQASGDALDQLLQRLAAAAAQRTLGRIAKRDGRPHLVRGWKAKQPGGLLAPSACQHADARADAVRERRQPDALRDPALVGRVELVPVEHAYAHG